MRKSLYFLITILLVGAVYAEDTSQTFLSLKNTGVEAFRTAHPEYDGRGTIVLILDTGVDMGVDGLITTTTGERKVIDVQDFTGQGDTPFFIAEIDEQNGKEIFINEKKNFKVAGANKLKLNSMNDKYFIGVLKESLWKNSGSHAGDINGNGIVENYKLVMIPGFANEPCNIEIGITEKSYFSNPYNLIVESDKKNTLKMYPDINYLLNCKCDKPDLKVPDGYSYFGGITFTSNKTNEVEFTKIININM